MTNKQAIETLERAVAQVEWDYPMEIAAAIDRAVSVMRGLGTKYVRVVRCEKCVDWEAPSKKEQIDGCTTGHCRARFCPCDGRATDRTWFCADGERNE